MFSSGLSTSVPDADVKPGWNAGRLAAILPCVLVLACSSPRPDDPETYTATIAELRAAKDQQFQREDDPIPASRKAEFLPLAYYPIDPDYHRSAALKPAEERVTVTMPTSSGQLRRMIRLGTLEFTLKGEPMTLSAFTEGDINRLFVPFGDATNGTETYNAGRFLDLDRTATGLYELDFNRAYIPYCYYNAAFECPFPPAENRLKVPVRAGERMKPAGS